MVDIEKIWNDGQCPLCKKGLIQHLEFQFCTDMKCKFEYIRFYWQKGRNIFELSFKQDEPGRDPAA